MAPQPHPILQESFTIIDREMGPHSFTPAEYAILRRVIHSTADFDYKHHIYFSPGAIAQLCGALAAQVPIITDVSMVTVGIQTLVNQTFANPILTAVNHAKTAPPGKTRTETGLLACHDRHPGGLYVIGNAPTALLALGDRLHTSIIQPAGVIAAPVGFVSVVESKRAIAQWDGPQIRIEGRKGGSAVAAGIVNALLMLAWEQYSKG